MIDYTANAGQTYIPFQDNVHVPTLPFTPLPAPDSRLPELQLNAMARERGWVIASQHQHYIAGVTAAMLDWFWANMEKCYYLWAPGSHKRFSWVREPWKYGFIHSAHCISESVGDGFPVFGGNGVTIERLDMDMFPFDTALEHVICEGLFNGKREFVDMTVHMWQDVPRGCVHTDACVANPNISEPPEFILEMLKENPMVEIMPPSKTDHGEYEASRRPVFLPVLYELWKDHPDPSQNVSCNLTVVQTAEKKWEYSSPSVRNIVRMDG